MIFSTGFQQVINIFSTGYSQIDFHYKKINLARSDSSQRRSNYARREFFKKSNIEVLPPKRGENG
jgi:hypothetical protein